MRKAKGIATVSLSVLLVAGMFLAGCNSQPTPEPTEEVVGEAIVKEYLLPYRAFPKLRSPPD